MNDVIKTEIVIWLERNLRSTRDFQNWIELEGIDILAMWFELMKQFKVYFDKKVPLCCELDVNWRLWCLMVVWDFSS